MPVLPDLALVPQLLLGGVSLGLIGLIQGAGVSKTVPNSDGRYGNVSKDFTAQGISNIASGLFKGIPIGGSVSGTAVNISAGAASRWACILAGPLTIGIVMLFAGVVEQFAMPAIAGLLIVAGFQSIKVDSWQDVWFTGWIPRLVMLVTFIATLVLPIQNAVLLGVVLSILLYVYQSSLDVTVKQLVFLPDSSLPQEHEPPATVEPHTITVLTIYGSVFYASADILQQALPSVYTADQSVVILVLRARNDLGSTFLKLLERYALDLRSRNSKLMLVGVSPVVHNQLVKTGVTDVISERDLFLATSILGESLLQAKASAEHWLETVA
jgi:SulP family sulfate permease